MRIKNKKIDEFFKKLPVSKNYETKIILNRAFLQKEKEQYVMYCSFKKITCNKHIAYFKFSINSSKLGNNCFNVSFLSFIRYIYLYGFV